MGASACKADVDRAEEGVWGKSITQHWGAPGGGRAAVATAAPLGGADATAGRAGRQPERANFRPRSLQQSGRL